VVAGRPGGAAKPQVEFPFRNALDIGTALGLRSLLKRERFDIVHAHVARDYPLVAAAALRLPVKVVFTRHLLYPMSPNILYRRVNGWLAPTRQILKTLDIHRPRASSVIPNWVDLEKFTFRPHPAHTPLTLGLLGQISRHKGHDDAIEAIRLLGPGHRLLIAGKGQNEYVAQLKERATGLPVHFPGFVSLPDFFDAIDVLLVPSWEEPFGIVILEAMASGIPVVSTTSGGPPELILSGTEGILIPPRNPQALAEAVPVVNSQRERVAQAARQRAEAEFDVRRVVPRIEDFYRGR
jgi:glycosyltransferase involved in cell wall biosynthesis